MSRKEPRTGNAWVWDRRAVIGLAQVEVADKRGPHRTFIGSVERGEQNISLPNLRVIAAALRLPHYSRPQIGGLMATPEVTESGLQVDRRVDMAGFVAWAAGCGADPAVAFARLPNVLLKSKVGRPGRPQWSGWWGGPAGDRGTRPPRDHGSAPVAHAVTFYRRM